MRGVPPNHPFLDGISHDKASSYWGLRFAHDFGNPFLYGTHPSGWLVIFFLQLTRWIEHGTYPPSTIQGRQSFQISITKTWNFDFAKQQCIEPWHGCKGPAFGLDETQSSWSLWMLRIWRTKRPAIFHKRPSSCFRCRIAMTVRRSGPSKKSWAWRICWSNWGMAAGLPLTSAGCTMAEIRTLLDSEVAWQDWAQHVQSDVCIQKK